MLTISYLFANKKSNFVFIFVAEILFSFIAKYKNTHKKQRMNAKKRTKMTNNIKNNNNKMRIIKRRNCVPEVIKLKSFNNCIVTIHE
jgi:hypothetical protein